jgi:hypothetical protein
MQILQFELKNNTPYSQGKQGVVVISVHKAE